MKNRVKKSISLLLAVIMLLCAVPVTDEILPSVRVKAVSSVQSALDSVISTYPAGSRWTGSFDGGKQCYGFAKLVIYKIFGKNSSGGYRSWNYAGVSTSGMKTLGSITSFSSSNVKNLLSSAKCGDVLQFNTTKQHSMIIYSVDSSGVTIYDCNWDNNCGIRKTHVGFGTWSGRNSSKLTLLRSDNYPIQTHTVDSSYGKNFTAYPKAKITAGNIFDANHNQISSTAWIGTSDKCTIHEVYTDGCCKVTYPLDSGGTRTVYSKISLFNTHTHSYYRGVEAAHPHKVYMKCSCGDYYYTGATNTSTNCVQCCENAKYTLTASPSTLTMRVGETKTVTFTESSDGFAVTMNGEYSNDTLSNVSMSDWIDSCKKQVTFTAIKAGTGTINMVLKAYLTGKVVKTLSYKINILPDKYTVSFDANGGSGAPSIQTKKYTKALTLSSTKPKRSGYTFQNWNTKADGSGTTYSSGASYTTNANVTLYARWIPNTVIVYYNVNGGTVSSETYKVSSDYIYTKSDSVKYYQKWTYNNPQKNGLVNASTLGLQRQGYKFAGWSTSASGGTVFDQNNASIVPTDFASEINNKNCAVTMYAQWKENKYTVTYNANGGSGAPSSQTKKYTEALTLSSTKPKRSGYTFQSWNTKADGSGTTYLPGASYTTNANVTLYAQWKSNSCSHTYDSGKITTAATCKSTGVKTYTCTVCKATKTETLPKNPSNHVGGTAVKNALAATCTAKGYTGDTYCLGCGVTTVKGKEIAAKGHTDTNNDGKCDICGTAVGTPAEPEKPDTPSAACNHICHKSGIAHFFYLIARLFWKMFKTNKYCSCGAAHY